MNTYVETERLSLRRFAVEDADLLIELDSDPEVMRYLSGGEPTSPEVVRDEYIPAILSGYERWGGRFGLYAAYEKDGDAFIGWFYLRPGRERDAPLDVADIGYRLRQPAWGKGYATEGSQALLHKGFSELGLRLVWAETAVVNRRSRNVMEKLGMTLKRAIPTPPDMAMIDGAEHGGVEYEITEEQWRTR
jgi:RimJ/RimL family protein N-acetyltransferase